MAFLQFPDTHLIKTIDTAETIEIGKFKMVDHQEFRYVRVLLYQNGTPGGTENMQMRLHTGDDLTAVYATSNTVQLSAVTDNLSLVRFDFERPNINKNLTYTVSMVVNNYTRNADTYYLGVSYDFPNSTYSTITASEDNYTSHPLKMELFGFK